LKRERGSVEHFSAAIGPFNFVLWPSR